MKNHFILLIIYSFLFSIEFNSYSNASELDISNKNKINQKVNLSNHILYDFIDIETYETGPGDVFLFNMISTMSTVNLELVISPSGTILIPTVGVIDVKGKKAKEVRDIIKSKCMARHDDAYVYVELIKLRNFKVLIAGDFYASGMYEVSSTDRVSDLIESVASLKNKSNFLSLSDSILSNHLTDFPTNIFFNKDIYLIRNNSELNVDLFKYYMEGDFSLNPILKEGDIVKIKESNKILVLGEVKNPIRIPKDEGMSYSDAVKKSGGLIETADKLSIKVINYKLFTDYYKDELNRISETEPRYRSDIDESFFNSRVKSERGLLYIKGEKNINKFLNLELNYGDVIIVPRQKNYIELIGGLNKPGSYTYNSSFTVSDYINSSGGFSDNAREKNIYLVDDISSSRIKISGSYIPKPGESIFIEEKIGFKSWDRFSESIKLAGTLATMSLVFYNIWDKSRE